ncbi:MAG: gluconolaconase [Acidobacteria bacterium]|nr:gluconolaconase [Acidobacteriota bacterium]
MQIKRVNPAAAIPGGEVLVECEGFDTSRTGGYQVLIGGERARLVGASPGRVLAIVPEDAQGRTVEVRLACGGAESQPGRLVVGKLLADELHMVANPAFDPEDGALYVTRSGSRGHREPVSLFRVGADGELRGVTGEVVNPTGLAFDADGQLYVSSRNDGSVYRVTKFDEAIQFAQNLGVATGLAFDRRGQMYVGDRAGTIHRVNGIGESHEWASLEASVAAYHLAFGEDGALYVSAPTVSSSEAIIRVDEGGRATPFFKGLGRPGGLAFDAEGNLYVAASYKGRRGIVRITREGERAELVVAGMNVIGLAFSAAGEMVVATNDAVYSLPLGIRGTLLG